MSALPTMHIPVVVNTEKVAPAMKAVEKTVSESAARLSKIKSAINPIAGSLGGGQFASIVGGLSGGSALGIGAIGAGLPILALMKGMDALENNTRGASEALKQFRETGKLTMAANSQALEILAAKEQQAATMNQGGRGFGYGFSVSAEPTSPAAVLKTALSDVWTQLGSIAGSGLMNSNSSLQEAWLSAQLSTAKTEPEAERLRKELEAAKAERLSYGDTNIGPITNLMKVVEKIAYFVERGMS